MDTENQLTQRTVQNQGIKSVAIEHYGDLEEPEAEMNEKWQTTRTEPQSASLAKEVNPVEQQPQSEPELSFQQNEGSNNQEENPEDEDEVTMTEEGEEVTDSEEADEVPEEEGQTTNPEATLNNQQLTFEELSESQIYDDIGDIPILKKCAEFLSVFHEIDQKTLKTQKSLILEADEKQRLNALLLEQQRTDQLQQL